MIIEPKKIHIETVLGCNARCIMCPNSDQKTVKNYFMDDKTFHKIINEALMWKNLNSIKLSLNGEPLLDKKIVERIRYIKNKKEIRTTFNTNGGLLNENTSRDIIESGLDRINIHISGFGNNNYKQVMKGLDFERVKKNVLKFKALSRDIKSPIVIAIKYVILKENISTLDQAREYWESQGFLFRPDVLNDRAGALKKFNDLKIYVKTGTNLKPCSLIFNHLFVRHDGLVISCWNDWYSTRVFGNVLKDKLINIFNNEKFVKLREGHLKKQIKSNSICGKCNWEDKDE